MSLFQKSVEKKYLNELDSGLVDKKFNDFQSYFGNTEIQENIRNLKEEEFQEGFIRELFVNILNYTLKPTPEYNIVLEKKNVDDTKKADGAILKNDHVRAVIELKSTSTADLDMVETQAFGYKNHHPECVYVITSNFEKLRFYIQNAVDYLEFDLFNLSKEQFSLLWLCLSKDNIFKDLPLTIKESSVLQEEDVTKKLYADYSKFREAIFENIAKNNPDKNELLLFNKTQKLLDRFLFIFFAEDRLLLPPNSISEIVKQWTTLKEELDAYIPLYDRFKKYFGYMNTGYKGKKYDIFPYNGGLFLPDEILDNITIDDNILHEHTLKLSTYDFETDVDVNILGHIFEHSLAEIENVQAKLRGEQIDKQKTKRKKEGIYYTPKYITKYIVENTVGKLCEEKRNELEIIDEEYTKGRKNRKKDTIKALDKKLTAYKNWLLSLTILDPACGSGAFLNQALEFLINEHKKIDELRAQLFGGMVFSDITTEILEKNIYGVDLNEESVEIAKLSLWLRTAQKGRKLSTLSSNIKCGNSLIDDPEIAGKKAFNWQKEFPEIFAQGGFDVVIGNPPYVRVQNLDYKIIDWLKSNKSTAYKRIDISTLFIEESLKLINQNGIISFITSNQFFKAEYGRKVREFIKNHLILNVDFSNVTVFEGLATYVSILNFSKVKSDYLKYVSIENIDMELSNIDFVQFDYELFTDEPWDFNVNYALKNKLYSQSMLLGDLADFVYGIITGNDMSFILTKEEAKLNNLESRILYNFVKPENYEKYAFKDFDKYIIYPYNKENDIHTESDFQSNFPIAYNYLLQFKEILENRKDSRVKIKDRGLEWFTIMRRVHPKDIESTKIIFYDVGNHPNFCLDNKGVAFGGGTSHSLTIRKGIEVENEYLLALLNSKLLYWVILDICPIKMGGARKYGLDYMRKLPIKVPALSEQNRFIVLSKKYSVNKSNVFKITQNFLNLLKSKFNLEKPSKKLQNWDELEFKEFLKELKKAKIKLSLSEEAEWMQYFNEQKEKVQTLKSEIDKIDKEIDQMVYELYGLTEEEIKIVEEAV